MTKEMIKLIGWMEATLIYACYCTVTSAELGEFDAPKLTKKMETAARARDAFIISTLFEPTKVEKDLTLQIRFVMQRTLAEAIRIGRLNEEELISTK